MTRIEHLTREVLALFPGTVFGAYRPPLVIVSTPNAEFNAHFPNLRYGTSQAQFRHEDHKFEWTRQEFQDWYAHPFSRNTYVTPTHRRSRKGANK